MIPTPSDPTIVSMRCLAAEPCSVYDWHEHAFYEFTFVSDDGATIGYPPGMRPVARDTLLFYRVGERHAGWSGPQQRPRFWVVHFSAEPSFLAPFPRLNDPNPERRLWVLRPERAEVFRWLFLQILNERTLRRDHQAQAEASWLQLLLISVHRWTLGDNTATLSPDAVSPELIRLWHLVNASVSAPADFQRRIHDLPNYDSLRHGFKRAFGCSPREMMLRLRIQHAKNLLLESRLSIKEIADRCGYQRQHEFARSFRQHTGVTATAWREQPLVRLSASAK